MNRLGLVFLVVTCFGFIVVLVAGQNASTTESAKNITNTRKIDADRLRLILSALSAETFTDTGSGSRSSSSTSFPEPIIASSTSTTTTTTTPRARTTTTTAAGAAQPKISVGELNSTTVASAKDPYSEFVGPIRKCPKGTDEDLNYCMKLILNDLKPKLAKGVPEIDLPPLDPLHIPRSNFHQGFGAIVIKAIFTNISVYGLSEFNDAAFTVNSKAKLLNFKMIVPKLRIQGTYTLGGNILFFPIGGTGPYWFELANVNVNGLCKLKTEKRPERASKKIVLVDSITIDIDIEKIKIQLLNLFNGNQVLGPLINNVLNENGVELFQDIKPTVAQEVGEIMSSIVNAVISNLDFIGDYLD